MQWNPIGQAAGAVCLHWDSPSTPKMEVCPHLLCSVVPCALQESCRAPASAKINPTHPLQPGWAQLWDPGTAEGSGCTPHPSAGSLFRTGYCALSGKPFELLNWSYLLLFEGCDAWSVSSVKGLLKYKVLMKSCLVGEQYHLTGLFKKSCLKDQSTSFRSFQGLGKCSPVA